jgi:hypothetical protein
MYGQHQFKGLKRWGVLALSLLGVGALVAHTASSVNAAAADVTPPTITAIASAAPNANGWYRANVRVRFVCADTGGSGVASCPAAQTIATEGEGQVVTGTARDRAGNTASASLTLNIDKTAPVVTAARAPEATANGWVGAPVTVTFSATDALSGVLPDSTTAAITYTTDRTNTTATGRATDLAGNVGKVTLPGISIDVSKPRITVSVLPAHTGSNWRNAPVTAHFTCTDTRSGIASCPGDQTLATEGRSQIVTGTTVDNVGLSSTVTATVHIDLTAPTVTTKFSRVPDVNGWYTSPVTASFKCTDALSGVFACPTPVTMSAEGANQPLGVVALDRARNASAPAATVNLDLTAPTLSITSPAGAAEVDTETTTIVGTVADAASGVASLTVAGTPVSMMADGSFSTSVSLAEGANSFVIVATDHAGRTTSQTVSVTRHAPPPPPPPVVATNLFEDPGFEAGVSGVTAQDDSSSVSRVVESPIDGAASLRVSIAGYGNNVWWFHNFDGGLASHFLVRARARSEIDSASALQFCAMIYFADDSTDINCSTLTGAAGDKGIVTAELPIDPTKRLQSVRLRMYQEGGAPVSFTFDDAVANLDVVEAPPPGGGDNGGGGGDGGGGDGGGGSIGCTVPAPGSTPYPGFTYNLPLTRPFISLASYTQADQQSTTFARFRNAADQAIAGDPPYAYSAVHSVIMYRLTGNTAYIDHAIARVEGFVADAEAAIALGQRPSISGDSYLEIGWYMEQIATVYDAGYDRLTTDQRQRWEAFAEQSLFNLWHPSEAKWGDVDYPWTGWSICDPGNNYHFHFLRATMMWALATKSTAWLEFLQTEKFPPLVQYYVQLAGGGSREGTGYGTAQKDLFENFLFWKDSTGEDLSALTVHTRETIDYWVNATVPTRDRFAPIGDQSRSSIPDLFDYHENLVHTAVVLNPGTPQAQRGTWWLRNNSVNGVSQAFNLMGDLLPLNDTPMVPTERVYHATGAGVLFARSSWNTDASWLSFMAGKYDQSHAHQDQGAFTFFKGDWLAVTANIWSNSGINQEVEFHNTLRFERADGSVIGQSPSDTVQSSMAYTNAGTQLSVSADLANAYARNASLVQAWTRNLEYVGDTLRVYDNCTVANGVRAIFQLHVPVTPVVQEDGSLIAGNLHIVPLQGATFTITPMPSAQFSRGYRIDFTSTVGCSFAIELRGQ